MADNALNDNIVKASNGIGASTHIVSLSKVDIPQADVDAAVAALAELNTVAAIAPFEAGVDDVVYVAVQSSVAPEAGINYGGVTGVTLAVVCSFPNQ